MADKLRKTHAKMHIAKLEKKGVFLVILTNFGKDACKNAYCKIGKKGCVFGHIDKFWKGHGGKLRKTHAIIGSIFIPENKRVCFGHIDKFWKGHGGQIKKNACKNTYL